MEPERASTYGGDVAELVRAYGAPLDPWQESVLSCWWGVDGDGRLTATTGGLWLPRQNGKNYCLEAHELYATAVRGLVVLHTAHEVKSAREAFHRIAAYFENDEFPELKSLVRAIRRANGQESVELANGGCVKFSARTRGAARGFTADVLVLDEAQELTDD